MEDAVDIDVVDHHADGLLDAVDLADVVVDILDDLCDGEVEDGEKYGQELDFADQHLDRFVLV